jgi:hypothetical protein
MVEARAILYLALKLYRLCEGMAVGYETGDSSAMLDVRWDAIHQIARQLNAILNPENRDVCDYGDIRQSNLPTMLKLALEKLREQFDRLFHASNFVDRDGKSVDPLTAECYAANRPHFREWADALKPAVDELAQAISDINCSSQTDVPTTLNSDTLIDQASNVVIQGDYIAGDKSDMSENYHANIGDGNQNVNLNIGKGINQVTAEKIKRSFNRAQSATSTSDEIKTLLQQLANEIAQLAASLSPEQAEEAADALDTLTREATRATPRRNWWDLSIEGVKEAVSAVGEAGKTTLGLLVQLVTLLGPLTKQ